MRKSLVITAFLALPTAALAAPEAFTIDPYHTYPNFTVDHLGVSTMYGRFDKSSGKVTLDRAAKSGSIDLTIETASVTTGDVERGSRPRTRDEHLRSADFFDVAKYPTITFKSTSVKSVAPGKLEVTGDFTLHGVTKPVVLTVTGGDVAKDPWGGTRTGFTATTTINRKDYGISWNKALDNGGVLVGEDVQIELEIEGTLKK